MTQDLENRVNRAVELFMKGYGCGQSVVAAFAELYGMDEATALKVGNGFGGGVGKMRMMCGAVSGLVILAGLESGSPRNNTDPESIRSNKTSCYKLVQDLLDSFHRENGSIICAELLGLSPLSSGEQGLSPLSSAGEQGRHGLKTGDFTPSERNSNYFKSRPCAAKVESAARIFAEYLSRK